MHQNVKYYNSEALNVILKSCLVSFPERISEETRQTSIIFNGHGQQESESKRKKLHVCERFFPYFESEKDPNMKVKMKKNTLFMFIIII